MEYTIYLEYLINYGLISLLVLGINAFMAGFTDSELSFRSVLVSIIWPLTLLQVLGTVASHFFTTHEE
jgi:hypothetical protein